MSFFLGLAIHPMLPPWYPSIQLWPVALAIDHLPSVAVGVAGARRLDVGADAGDLVLRPDKK